MPRGANPMLKDAKRGTQKMPRELKGCQKDAKGGKGAKECQNKRRKVIWTRYSRRNRARVPKTMGWVSVFDRSGCIFIYRYIYI